MNILKYYFYQFSKEFILVYPVYLLLFEQRGLTITQISLLLMIWSLPVVIFEIPSGILSDRWSRKKMIVLGSILKALCFLLWFLSNGFLMYAFGFVMWGLSSACCSGSEEALIYDSLKKNHNEEKFDTVYGKGQFLSKISVTFVSLAGGYIAMWFGVRWNLMFSIIACIITVGIAFSFQEINLYQEEKHKATQKETKMFMENVRFFFSRKQLMVIAFLMILVVGVSEVLDEYDQLIAKEFGLSIGLVGIWMGFRYVISALGNLCASKVSKRLSRFGWFQTPIRRIKGLCILGAICLGVAALIQQFWAMSFYGAFYFIMAICQVISEDYLQQQIEKEGRATVHSIVSLLMNLFAIIYFGILGGVFSVSNLFVGLLFSSVYMLILIACVGRKAIKNQN